MLISGGSSMHWVKAVVSVAVVVPVMLGRAMAGQDGRVSCNAADFTWTQVSEPDDGRSEHPGLLFLPVASGKTQLVLLGPVLGSMDLLQTASAVMCTPDGALLTAESTRSGEFRGGVHKNVLRRSRFVITVTFHQPEFHFQAEWIMRSTDGTVSSTAQTPPYPELRYPLQASVHLRR